MFQIEWILSSGNPGGKGGRTTRQLASNCAIWTHFQAKAHYVKLDLGIVLWKTTPHPKTSCLCKWRLNYTGWDKKRWMHSALVGRLIKLRLRIYFLLECVLHIRPSREREWSIGAHTRAQIFHVRTTDCLDNSYFLEEKIEHHYLQRRLAFYYLVIFIRSFHARLAVKIFSSSYR
jgi:hypothetical protein